MSTTTILDHTYRKSFRYKHDNPYHERLSKFSDFVFRDHEAESNYGQWNQKVFKKKAPLCLEIGSGYGHFMLEYCEANPDINFIGMDYRFKRSFELAKRLEKRGNDLTNINFRFLRARGERLEFLFSKNEVDNIFYFFPDPWPKNRHHKKRLFNGHFLNICHSILTPRGKIYIKTDHTEYWEHMAKVISSSKLFKIKLITKNLRADYPSHFLSSITTKFEKIFLKQNILIKAFELEAIPLTKINNHVT